MGCQEAWDAPMGGKPRVPSDICGILLGYREYTKPEISL